MRANSLLLIARTFKTDASLIQRLRKETQLPITIVKDALMKSLNSYESALKHLVLDAANSASKKADKVKGRQTCEGILAAFQSDSSASLVELNCESDFVAKSPHFISLIQKISLATLNSSTLSNTYDPATNQTTINQHIKHLDINEILPLECTQENTIEQELTKTIGLLGENIVLRRVAVIPCAATELVAAYTHSSSSMASGLGRIGCILKLNGRKNDSVAVFAKRLAQHISGMDPPDIPALLLENYLFGDGNTTVGQAIDAFNLVGDGGVELIAFVRWQCGEGFVKSEKDFADEVRMQLK